MLRELLLFVCLSAFVKGENILLEKYCYEEPRLFIANRTRELECCNIVVRRLYARWSTQRVYLSRSLETLKAWKCPQFQDVCKNRTLAFTDFTSLIYDRFCNENKLMQQCGKVVANFMGTAEVENQTWTELADKLTPTDLTMEQLNEPCIQVALYDAGNGSSGNFHEIVTFFIPFCQTSWCGYDYETIRREGISPWTCLPSRCRANIVILFILFVVLSILIVVANFTVILVYSAEKKARHSQGIFRLSLGVADIVIGLLIFPSAAGIVYKANRYDIQLGLSVNITGMERVMNTSDYTNSTVEFNMIKSRQAEFLELFPEYFLNIVGFFSTVSITVSIYLLTVSGIDRLMAITRPVAYRQHKAKVFARVSSMIAWLLAAIVSTLPFYIPSLEYQITGTGIVTLIGTTAIWLYTIVFFLPLVVTWAIAIAMFVQTKKSFRRRATMSTIRHQQIQQQTRLTRILSLMVIAFSVSVIPTVLILVLVIFIPGTNPTRALSYNSFLNNVANSLESVATIILLSNSLWNCLIYSIRTKTFRKSAAQQYRRIWNAINPFRLFKGRVNCRRLCERMRVRRRSSKFFVKSCKTQSSQLKRSTGNSTTVDSRSDKPATKDPIGQKLEFKSDSATPSSALCSHSTNL